MRFYRNAVVLAAGLVVGASACETPSDVHTHDVDAAFVRTGTGGLSGLAKQVRQATAPYHSTVQALDGQPFDVGGTPVPVPHWSLHMWVHKDNPNGLFTPFNPNVSCPS